MFQYEYEGLHLHELFLPEVSSKTLGYLHMEADRWFWVLSYFIMVSSTHAVKHLTDPISLSIPEARHIFSICDEQIQQWI